MADGTEAMVEDDEREAKAVLRDGLEQAIVEHENAIDSIAPYVVDTGKSAEVQAEGWEAHRVDAARVKTEADAAMVTV
jgi:hypothetical protein